MSRVLADPGRGCLTKTSSTSLSATAASVPESRAPGNGTSRVPSACETRLFGIGQTARPPGTSKPRRAGHFRGGPPWHAPRRPRRCPGGPMDALFHDLRHAARTLARAPGFTLVVVLTLGLGIGANTAIFTLLDQVMLRLLPVERPEELVLLDGPGANMGARFGEQTFSYPMYRDFRDKSEVFSGVIARFGVPLSLEHAGQSERAAGELVSGNFFEVLGVRPA